MTEQQNRRTDLAHWSVNRIAESVSQFLMTFFCLLKFLYYCLLINICYTYWFWCKVPTFTVILLAYWSLMFNYIYNVCYGLFISFYFNKCYIYFLFFMLSIYLCYYFFVSMFFIFLPKLYYLLSSTIKVNNNFTCYHSTWYSNIN